MKLKIEVGGLGIGPHRVVHKMKEEFHTHFNHPTTNNKLLLSAYIPSD